ncbi:hypothetical protein K2173_007035 [Erythroxylum novogranatense]|uniref:TCP domain-containing protein n=1 Tax=Erythroxylum novogranatense TaxID=1862640 RepID=A0AAV8SKH5_9ROSI|nr:hypothetical protein K2173_007035 [Erythroxylum novogranatense]
MITNSRENDFQGKREGDDGSKDSKAASTSRHWSAFRNPRIVRASRSCGGKDRHSKVCTIRGLRDRRIRLSVPTAIQLYDLQDRLGLAQPSKVIDWLIDATKTDIDKLPPLQFPQGFGQLHQQMLVPHQLRASDQSSIPPLFGINASYAKDSLGIKIDNSPDRGEQNTLERPKYWNIEASLREKSKEDESITDQKGKWIETNDPQYQGGICNYSSSTGQAQRFFPLTVHSSLPSLLNSSMPFNSYHHIDASNLSFPQFGTHGVVSHSENSLNSNTVPFPSSLPLSAGSQLLFCPPATMSTLFSPFNPYGNATIGNSREISHLQLLGSSPSQHRISGPHAMSSSSVKTFPFNLNPGPVHFQSSNDDHHNKYNVNS